MPPMNGMTALHSSGNRPRGHSLQQVALDHVAAQERGKRR
jgi:hypothetical protein